MSTFRIVALGDSLTYGYPFGNPLSWVQGASEELGIPILNQGTNGDTIGRLLRRLNIDVLDINPEICLILGGTNDVFQDVDLETMKSNFSKLTEKLLEQKILPVVGLPPPVQDKEIEKNLTKFRNWLKRHAKACSLQTIDFHKCFLDKRKRILPGTLEDGVHPSAKGYELMAESATKCLNKILEA